MKKNNEVFHISLTELAFTLVLLLVMLLGTRLVSEFHKAHEQERVINEQDRVINEQDRVINEQREAIRTLTEDAGICRPDPDDPISPMMPCNKCLSVVAHISKNQAAQAIDLGKSITEAVNNIQLNADYGKFKRNLIEAAKMIAEGKELADKNDLLETSNKLNQSQEEVNKLSSLLDELQNEKKDHIQLLGEVENLQKKIQQCEKDIQTVDTQNKYLARIAGLGFPPCWVGSNGKPQYLFSIDLLPNDELIVNRAWPEERNQEALAMEPVSEVYKYFGKTVPMSRFLPAANKILDISNNSKPSACRHFVILKNHIPDRPTGDKQRLKIENSFYKLEVLSDGSR